MSPNEHDETVRFASAQWAVIVIDTVSGCECEADELIILAASYGPARTITTD